MRRRLLDALGVVAAGTGVLLLAVVPLAGQSPKAAPTAVKVKTGTAVPSSVDGHPDLSGIWDYRTITPLERPSELAGKEAISDEESADLEKKTVQARNQDRRDGAGTDADVARAYNDFWWDFGKTVIKNRTSLVIDPPDGKIPALTPDGQKRADLGAGARQRPAAGPEETWRSSRR